MFVVEPLGYSQCHQVVFGLFAIVLVVALIVGTSFIAAEQSLESVHAKWLTDTYEIVTHPAEAVEHS